MKLLGKPKYKCHLPPNSRWYKMRFWDPIIGCSPISEGCRICSSARTLRKKRTDLIGNSKFNGVIELNHKALEEVSEFAMNEQVFACGRSDIFHKEVSYEFVDSIMAAVISRPDCLFFVITKRANRMADYWNSRELPDNLWMSITAENQKRCDQRIGYLESVDGIRILSAKPLLGPIDLSKYWHLIDMVIVGGEYGPDAKPMHPDWARSIRDQAIAHDKPFSFHNWGSWIPGDGYITRQVTDQLMHHHFYPHEGKEKDRYLLDGVMWDQYPDEKINTKSHQYLSKEQK